MIKPIQRPRRNQFLAINNTIRSAPPRQAAATLAVKRFVDATIRTIPQKAEPRYPAGRINQYTPPRVCVTPPSSAWTFMPSTWPQVSLQAIAWLASCRKTVISLNGVNNGVLQRARITKMKAPIVAMKVTWSRWQHCWSCQDPIASENLRCCWNPLFNSNNVSSAHLRERGDLALQIAGDSHLQDAGSIPVESIYIFIERCCLVQLVPQIIRNSVEREKPVGWERQFLGSRTIDRD